MLLYMDKYLDKNNNSNNGLDNICNRTRNLKDYNKERNYNEVLTGFKQMISHRILKFNPKKINDNFGFSIGAGLQYFELPDVIVNNTKGDNLPPYVQKKIDSIIANTNEELDKYGKIIPTITINTSFIF